MRTNEWLRIHESSYCADFYLNLTKYFVCCQLNVLSLLAEITSRVGPEGMVWEDGTVKKQNPLHCREMNDSQMQGNIKINLLQSAVQANLGWQNSILSEPGPAKVGFVLLEVKYSFYPILLFCQVGASFIFTPPSLHGNNTDLVHPHGPPFPPMDPHEPLHSQ